MLKIDANYSDYYDGTDVNYPAGKAIDASATDSIDGTPWLAKFFNDIIGARQAIWKKAFGNLIGISGNEDNANNSDVLTAILKLIDNSFNEKLFQVEIAGEETVIAWNDLGLTFDADATYAVIVNAAGNYPEFLSFGGSAESDGIHIYARRLVDGKITPGTRHVTWGARNWGVGLWNDYASMNVNLQVQKVS